VACRTHDQTGGKQSIGAGSAAVTWRRGSYSGGSGDVADDAVGAVGPVGAVDKERLLREAQICRKVTHPNVVRVFDVGRYEGGIFITMELLEGEPLDALMAREGQLPLVRVKGILEEIGAGLEEAHAIGDVHRDRKPGNIMLTPARLKILDFGFARMIGVESRLTRSGFALGSALYISPEQLRGAEPDGRARPGLPAGWAPLVHRLLAKQPADRYATVRDVLAALAPLAVEPAAALG
jgi:serine/threonine protein kinase